MSDPATLAETLHATIADLDRFIDLRAQELAAPRIAEIRTQADRAVDEAQRETRRQTDLTKELRRQLTAMEDHLDNFRIRYGERRDPEVARRRPAVDTGLTRR